jgi:ribosomal protein S18 acetylase RimI-like enzyme
MSSSPLRELRAEDADAVAALFRAAYGDARPLDAEEIRSWLANEEFEPGTFRVLEDGARVAGYGDIWVLDGELALDVAAPGHWDVFFDWAEREARVRGVARVRTNPPAGHEVADVCKARGYRHRRSSFTMEIELEAPGGASLPAGFELRPYRDLDDEELIQALNEAFAADPFWHRVTPSIFREFYLRARGFDPDLWLLAWHGDDLAGFALAYPERGGNTALGWVATLGVRGPWRRQGLGAALLRLAFQRLYAHGLRRAGLGVDAGNATGALGLYERAGMRRVRQTDNWVLDL